MYTVRNNKYHPKAAVSTLSTSTQLHAELTAHYMHGGLLYIGSLQSQVEPMLSRMQTQAAVAQLSAPSSDFHQSIHCCISAIAITAPLKLV